MSSGRLHCVQSLRARRWAVIRMTEDAMLKGATPMFRSRISVAGASLVCSVDSTRWPVCAAFTAMSAVSRSRISPTMMMSGSCRRNARSAIANVIPALSLTLTWLTPGRLISAGSSAVEMLTPGWLRICSIEYSDTVFPEPIEPLERLEMDVGRAGRNRVEQDLLDVADDRRIIDLGAVVLGRRRRRQLVEVDLQILGRHQRRQRRVARLDNSEDRLRQLR